METFPNILLISQTIPQTVYAGSILLHRLLKNYPEDKLLVIGSPPHPKAELLSCRYESLEIPLDRLSRTRWAKIYRSLGSFNLLPQMQVSSIKSLLNGFQADLVLSVMQVQPFYHLAYRFAKSQKLPLALIVHDIPERFEAVENYAVAKQLAKSAEVYGYASKRFCVTPELRDYLEPIYKASGDVLYPNRSESITPRPISDTLDLKQPDVLTVGYAGTMSYGYGKQLQYIIPALRKAGVKLRIYSLDCLITDAPDVVTNCGYAKAAEITWERVKAECDAVILPYCWSDDEHQELYKTHFPSKLSEYLALRMPVLIIGPSYATGVKWGLQNPDAAIVVSENKQEFLVNAFTQLKLSVSLRERLSQAAFVSGCRDFDPAEIRNQFLKSLVEISNY
jgi:glycosyltransferase involved in cell wall biosynthesis